MNQGDKSSVVTEVQSLFTTRKGLSRLLLVIVIIGIGASIPTLHNYEWSGFGKDSNKSESTEETVKDGKVISTKKTKTEHFQSPKTLWDWLGLGGTIAIPVMIYVFQAGEQRRAEKRANAEKEAAENRAKVEREIADANLREEALQAYIDRMAEILIDKDRRLELLPDKNNNNDTNTDNPVRDVVRVRTTTILRRLEGDIERQGHVLDFLRDAELLEFILSGANLSGANLSSAYLSSAYLRGTKLIDANLSIAYLIGADLSSAYLINADLSDANLIGADLSSAYLSDANLSGADLSGADLRGAKNLTVEQIKTAINWEKVLYSDELRSQLGLKIWA